MNNQINDFIKNKESEQFATQNGRIIHAKLQNIVIGKDAVCGDADLIAKIIQNEELKSFFVGNTRSEVPIAGIIDGFFISRRIDRLCIDDNTKTVRFLDYKTDTDSEKFRAKYITQLKEYAALLKQIYPNYKVFGYILWLHDWNLEKII